MSAPWLSVVLPVHNGAAYLREALDSVVAQGAALDGVEVLAVDDGSTDDSPAILAGYDGTLPLRVLSPGRLGSWVAATNHGIAAARGRYVSFLHQDDRWRPGRVRALEAHLSSQDRFLVHDAGFIGPTGRHLGPWRHGLSSTPPGGNLDRLLVQNVLAICAPAVPTELFAATGPLDTDLWYTADWDCWLRAARRYPTEVVPGTHVEFRVHPGSQTVVRSGDGGRFRAQLETVLDRQAEAVDEDRSGAVTMRLARASIELNVALAGALGGGPRQLADAVIPLLRLGPRRSVTLMRRSRLHERVYARLRGGLAGSRRTT